MTFDPALIGNLLLVLTGFGGAFLAALWISLVIWTYRDIRTRARDPLAQTLATLLVAVLNLPGVLVYLILRPQRTLEEEYQRTLEEEALLQALEDLPLCPGCERRVKDDWQGCDRVQHEIIFFRFIITCISQFLIAHILLCFGSIYPVII